MKKQIIFIVLISSLCFAETSSDIEHSNSYYYRISLNQNITKEIKINDIVNWFKTQVKTIEFKSEKHSNYIYTIYYFRDEKTVATLYIIFKENEEIYSRIELKMCCNGSPKIYIGSEAIRIMLTLLNMNDEYNYHFK